MAAPRYSGAKKNAISLVQSCIISYIPLSYSINSPKTMTDDTIKALDDIIEAEVRRRVNIVESTLQASQINVPTVSIPNYPHKPAPDFACPPLPNSEPTREMVVDERIGAIEKHMEFIDGHVYPAVPDLINRLDQLEERLASKAPALRRLNVDRFDELESKATSAGGMLDNMDKRIEGIEEDIVRLDSVGRALHRIEDRMVDVEGRVRSHARLHTDMCNRTSDMYKSIDDRMRNINAAIDKHATRAYELKNEVEYLAETVRDLTKGVHWAQQHIEALERHTNILKKGTTDSPISTT